MQAQAGQDASDAGEGWLIPLRVSPDGKDSLRRGTSAGEVAALVAADAAVQCEREARWSHLQDAYHDPHAARAALDELVKCPGWTSAAARIEADPLQLGELRGKEMFFDGTTARAERQAAQHANGAIGPSLERIEEAEARADRSYRTGVDAQRRTEASAIPRLSPRPGRQSALWPPHRTRGAELRLGRPCRRTSVSLASCEPSVLPSSSGSGRRACALCCEPGAVAVPSVMPEPRPALDRVAELNAVMKTDERASADLALRQAESKRQELRQRLWSCS